jgi:hypothetical protein
MLNKLKDTATKLKDAGIEEAKKLAEEHIPDEILKNIQDKTKKVVSKTTSIIVEKNESQNSQTQESDLTKQATIKDKEQISSDESINETTSINNKAILVDLLNSRLPDWPELKRKADEIITKEPTKGAVGWLEYLLSIKKNHLIKGTKHDLWNSDNILILQPHPTIFEKFLSFLASIFSIFLYPWYALKNALQKVIQNIANKLGIFFSIFVLPVAFLAFIGDVVTMILEFVLSLPLLIFSPLTLIRSFFSMIFQFFAKLFARIIWALLLPFIGKILNMIKPDKIDSLKELLKRKPWIRYIILGFFRAERITDPFIIIPSTTVNQFFISKRSGIFSKGEYLVIVEGDKIVSGSLNRFWSWFKMLILPFYWERSVHIIHLPKDTNKRQIIIDSISTTLDMQAEKW